MTEEIYSKIWGLSGQVQSAEAYLELVGLTKELIHVYDQEDRLVSDPFSPTRERVISLPFDKIQKELKGAVCLITGGLGCVGTILVKELLKFDVKTIIILDNGYPVPSTEKVIFVSCDIRNRERVLEIFVQYGPGFVFHTAAQRDPGVAESEVAETVGINVLGTYNIVKACEAAGTVRQMIFSSTGKASRYCTREVYAATKKMAEFILDAYAKEGHVRYAMVRFTHILDNSLMNTELKNSSLTDNYLSVHSPGKYVTAQNATEAAHLMLNAVVYSETNQCVYLVVNHLAWPVESLAMALYHIKTSGRSIPIIFRGCPPGYAEKFFNGNMDWSRPSELNLLTNVYERKYHKLNPEDDIIISRPCSTDKSALENAIDKIRQAVGEKESRQTLLDGLADLVKESLKEVDQEETMDILRWGLDPGILKILNASPSDYDVIVPLLLASLEGSKYEKEADELLFEPTDHAIH